MVTPATQVPEGDAIFVTGGTPPESKHTPPNSVPEGVALLTSDRILRTTPSGTWYQRYSHVRGSTPGYGDYAPSGPFLRVAE